MTTLAIEGLLIFLLVITIVYCFILDRRLKVLRNGQNDLRKVISDLSQTTHVAQQAISGLRATADDVDQKLSVKLDEARAMTRHLEQLVAEESVSVPPLAIVENQAPTGNSIFLR